MRRPHLSTRSRATLLGAATLLLVVIGIVLVITGGDERPTAPTTTTTAPGTPPKATLDLTSSSKDAVSRLAGLSIPAGAADFLSASTEDRTQLDVTFTLPADQVDAFVAGSGLPTPIAGTRVITHSSPLWKVNPEGRVSGSSDDHGTVIRAVETVPEGDRVRVRIVLSPRS
ncbi:MAG: hypothetical protein JST64_10225 [Actinobacteria bacterium]|nr:hypothetical protein [Actinomycetota bacterium]